MHITIITKEKEVINLRRRAGEVLKESNLRGWREKIEEEKRFNLFHLKIKMKKRFQNIKIDIDELSF